MTDPPLGPQLGRVAEQAPAVGPPENWVPVERRFLGLDKATIVPTLIVVAIFLLIGTGVPRIADLLSFDDPIEAGDVLDLSGGVTVTPVPGWNLEAGLRTTDDVASGGQGTNAKTTLVNGGVTFSIVNGPFDGTPSQLLRQINKNNDQIKDNQGFHVTSPKATVTTSTGEEGVIESYTGTATEGIVAAFVIDGVGIEITAVGPPGAVEDQVRDVATMIDSISTTEGEGQ